MKNSIINNHRKTTKKDFIYSRLIHIIKENSVHEKLDKLKDINITLLEEDFFNKVNLFNWEDEEEKLNFINEMLALSPAERKSILYDMILGEFFNFE
ncbi:MAG: hypothetical protein JXA99_10565 [Candidatus Lokiarchaeota archaeon]|nr:hypothetical protein [Candidatus Lokiarchaeota archaeon]